MTEKRSDYRKKQQKSHVRIFDRIKSAFSEDQDDSLDYQPDQNLSEEPKRRSLNGNGQEDQPVANFDLNSKEKIRNEKGLKLKKRLNQTILILVVLIILVLLALFHL